MKNITKKLNTSNLGKFEEFKHIFSRFGITLEASHKDLREIDSDPIHVVAHKATQLGEDIIVDDTSLEIEGASVGINIRWLLNHLAEFVGRQATWIVLLAYCHDKQIFIYRGSVSGTIAMPRGANGFGFDPVFLPNGSNETLAESKPDVANARFKAVEALMENKIWVKHPIIEQWNGLWQKE